LRVAPYSQTASFDPEMVGAMGEAFERACTHLNEGADEQVRNLVAKRIVHFAKTGERDPLELCKSALGSLGIR
jgi:hypothetical protein